MLKRVQHDGMMMSMRTLLVFGLLLATLSACAAIRGPMQVINDSPRDWRAVATQDDRQRLRDWRDSFSQALKAARAAGNDAAIDREGALLQPDAAIAGPAIPNGIYRCRTIKLGSQMVGGLAYVAYSPFTCRIRDEQGVQGFAKLSGSQRPVGLIFPSDGLRQVFLGTLVLGDEQGTMHYGYDRERDVAAFVERVGPNRWRLVMPAPHFESLLDVMELVPAS
jgi:hypothetical protein